MQANQRGEGRKNTTRETSSQRIISRPQAQDPQHQVKPAAFDPLPGPEKRRQLCAFADLIGHETASGSRSFDVFNKGIGTHCRDNRRQVPYAAHLNIKDEGKEIN